MLTLVSEAQRLACACMEPDVTVALGGVRRLLRRVTDPATPVEAAFARTFLLDVALRCGDQLHVVFHRRYPGPCAFTPDSGVNEVWRHHRESGMAALGEWAAWYRTAFDRHHRDLIAQRAVDLIRADSPQVLNIGHLALELGTTPAVLRRAFRRTYGVSVREYHLRVRVVAAARRLAADGEKIETVARDSGWQSPKNMYSAIRVLTGRTPAELRALPARALNDILEHILPPPRIQTPGLVYNEQKDGKPLPQ